MIKTKIYIKQLFLNQYSAYGHPKLKEFGVTYSIYNIITRGIITGKEAPKPDLTPGLPAQKSLESVRHAY